MTPRVDKRHSAVCEVTIITCCNRRPVAGCDTGALGVHEVHRCSCPRSLPATSGPYNSACLNVERQYVIGHTDKKRLVGLLQRLAASPSWESIESVGDLSNSECSRVQLGRRLSGKPRGDRGIRLGAHEFAREIGIESDHEAGSLRPALAARWVESVEAAL